jgi:hypothetical protein
MSKSLKNQVYKQVRRKINDVSRVWWGQVLNKVYIQVSEQVDRVIDHIYEVYEV